MSNTALPAALFVPDEGASHVQAERIPFFRRTHPGSPQCPALTRAQRLTPRCLAPGSGSRPVYRGRRGRRCARWQCHGLRPARWSWDGPGRPCCGDEQSAYASGDKRAGSGCGVISAAAATGTGAAGCAGIGVGDGRDLAGRSLFLAADGHLLPS
jgi:hypothetical protein